jgi:Arc/MetJ-type ribon-helix-helix transcriptional regulator
MGEITVEINEKLEKRVEKTVENQGFESTSEYVRDALRNQLAKDEEVDAELFYRYLKVEKGEVTEAKSIHEVREAFYD